MNSGGFVDPKSGGSMFSGGFDPVSAGISGVTGLLGGACGGDDEQAPAGQTMLDKNKKLAIALMKAQMGRKLNLPMRPNLPSMAGNPQGYGVASQADTLARTKYGA